MTAPTITIIQDFETDLFHLMVTSFSTTEPAGPRLFRGGDLPDVSWCHDNEADARRDAAILQTYCTLAWAGKAPRTNGREEAEKTVLTKFDFANAVWAV